METNKKNWFAKHPILSIVIGLFTLLVIISAVGGGSKSTSQSSSTTTSGDEKPTIQPTSTQPKQWVAVFEANGTSDKRTDTFALQGGKTRLTYTFEGGDFIVSSIYVVKEGNSLEKSGGFPEVTVTNAGTDSTFLTKDAGKYYLDVKSANATWAIKIEEER